MHLNSLLHWRPFSQSAASRAAYFFQVLRIKYSFTALQTGRRAPARQRSALLRRQSRASIYNVSPVKLKIRIHLRASKNERDLSQCGIVTDKVSGKLWRTMHTIANTKTLYTTKYKQNLIPLFSSPLVLFRNTFHLLYAPQLFRDLRLCTRCISPIDLCFHWVCSLYFSFYRHSLSLFLVTVRYVRKFILLCLVLSLYLPPSPLSHVHNSVFVAAKTQTNILPCIFLFTTRIHMETKRFFGIALFSGHESWMHFVFSLKLEANFCISFIVQKHKQKI